MKITALVENTPLKSDTACEHGLSLYIEANGRKILFDSGQSNLFASNAAKLGKNLAEVELAILSHGHYDHGGGLPEFIKINSTAPIYASKYVFGDYYNGTQKYIGLDASLAKNPRFILTDGTTVIDKNMTLFSCNEKERPNYMGSFGLNELKNGKFSPDRFLHEQYLLITENGRKVLISGCSHKGIIDIVSWFRPDVVVGGFHYSKIAPGTALAEAAQKLDSYGCEYYTCHCTGTEQYEFMTKYIKKLHYLHCTESIEI